MKETFKLDDRQIKLIGWFLETEFHTIVVGEDGVTAIDCTEQFLGEYSIIWLQVWMGDRLAGRYNARNIDQIEYDDEDY